MEDDSELEMKETWPDDSTYPPKRTRMGSSKNKLFRLLLGILIVVVFAGGIVYFIARRPSGTDGTLIDSKMAALEQKIAGLEREIAGLQEKLSRVGPDTALLQRVDALAQKVEALEKRPQPPAEAKAKPAPPRQTLTTEKRYHTVRKGESLYKISKTYGITVEKLRKLNHLSPDQSIRPGQKLLVSPGP